MYKCTTQILEPFNIPQIISCSDYHELNTYKDILKKLHPKLKIKEISTEDSYFYYGLIYYNELPSKSIVTKLLKVHNK
jgi:hypothetical protein